MRGDCTLKVEKHRHRVYGQSHSATQRFLAKYQSGRALEIPGSASLPPSWWMRSPRLAETVYSYYPVVSYCIRRFPHPYQNQQLHSRVYSCGPKFVCLLTTWRAFWTRRAGTRPQCFWFIGLRIWGFKKLPGDADIDSLGDYQAIFILSCYIINYFKPIELWEKCLKLSHFQNQSLKV